MSKCIAVTVGKRKIEYQIEGGQGIRYSLPYCRFILILQAVEEKVFAADAGYDTGERHRCQVMRTGSILHLSSYVRDGGQV